ncbi:protein kinase [Plasmopara halstedii]|uniref:Protein kinase n=1 Tax=Plasmopara halstedii TaxID=4781 RepID=A0A0N7L494_PLAHL|nr:protein kinase [Plasmopara halstedii]CEG38043.1 protein kinase [Plasmopara halstedii]|eukprot:XP_024574412.1 protein kinase [Plasmopara halstedii]
MAFASSAVETLRPMRPVSPVTATAPKRRPASANPSSVKDRTVVVFDWDDTLCPSSWLHAQNLLPKYRGHNINITSEQREVLALVGEHVACLLQKAVAYGPIFIVTAAEHGWVEMSAALYLPSVQSVLALDDVHIVSARSWYEQNFGVGGDSATWKQEVMQLIALKCFASQNTTRTYRQSTTYFNFVSIGDSMAERDACFAAVQNVCHTFAKTLKFVEHPNAEEVLQQVKLTHDSFEQMCRWETSLDLRLSREQLVELRGAAF